MKPNQLTLTAFGPYRDKEIIDFDALSPHNLFVISGSTGSGKTTLFDGLSYALYGNASGEDRENYRSLRSDFADNDTPSRVELIFTVRGEQYRVARQIPYLREGNKTETPGTAEFFKLDKNSDEIPAVDRQNIRDVNEAIERLIGFTHDQFNQLVMLPQGEFRRFLTSNTENREVILRKIFNTEIYADLVDHFKIKRDDKKSRFERLMLQRDQLIHDITQLPKREIPFFDALSAEQLNIHQASAGLKEEQRFYQAQLATIQSQHASLKAEEEKAQIAYNRAERINQQFDELDKINASLKELSAKEPHIKAIAQEITLAEKAQPLAEKSNRLVELRTELAETKQTKEVVKKSHQTAIKSLKEAQKNYEKEAEKADQRETVFRQLIELDKQQPIVKKLEEKRQQEIEDGKRADQQSDKLTQLNDAIKKLRRDIDDRRKAIETHAESSQAFDETSRVRDLMQQQCQLMQKLEAERAKVAQLIERQRADVTSLEDAKRENREATERWLHNQAALLAADLVDNEPCPVCGGTDHPAPMDQTLATISETEYQASQQTLNEAREHYQRTYVEREHAEKNVATLEAEKSTLKITLNSSELEAEVKALDKTIDSICHSQEILTKLKAELSQQEALFTERETTLEQERELMHQYRLQYQESNIELRQMLNEIPEPLREPKAFDEALKAKKAERQTLEEAWKNAEMALKQAENGLTEEKTKLDSLTILHEEIMAQGKRLRAQFDALLIEQGFKNEREFRAAERPYSRIESLRNERQQHLIAVESLQNNSRSLETALINETRQPLTQLNESLSDIKNRLAKNIEQQLGAQNILKTIQTLLNRIDKNADELANAEADFGRLENIYNLIRGQNPLRLSFERYILIEYLERVIETANIRLRNITNGQFEFVRSEEQAARGRQSGLDLDVYDAYTGQTRDVKTMSGGEKFKASLSLSLGMADVIQSFKGGISIDTLFIDEGFGSLDEESLQQAIDLLIDLQKSGRMIGVISHVEELKQVLPARIEVTKTKSGFSRTAVVVD